MNVETMNQEISWSFSLLFCQYIYGNVQYWAGQTSQRKTRGVVHSKKTSYNPPKTSEKSKKSKNFFEDLKYDHLIWQ